MTDMAGGWTEVSTVPPATDGDGHRVPYLHQFRRGALALRSAQEIIRATTGKGPAADPRHTPWMPFPLFAFTALLAEAIPAVPLRDRTAAPRLLEVGAGPGPYLLVARDLFGLDARGIEINAAMAGAACSAGLPVQVADASAWSGYGDYDLVWLNRPIRDPGLEHALERRIWAQAAPGAVVICANLEDRPPGTWLPVLDDWDDLRRGIWARPGGPDDDPGWI